MLAASQQHDVGHCHFLICDAQRERSVARQQLPCLLIGGMLSAVLAGAQHARGGTVARPREALRAAGQQHALMLGRVQQPRLQQDSCWLSSLLVADQQHALSEKWYCPQESQVCSRKGPIAW